MKRIFISIDFSEEIVRFANSHIDAIKKFRTKSRVSWVKPGKMHLTLRFLGEIDDGLILKVNEAVAKVASTTQSFRLNLSKTGVFPGKRRPKILWLGIQDPTGALQTLKNKLDERLDGLGLNRESRAFKPHLTISRFRETKGVNDLVEFHLRSEFTPLEFDVSEIAVVESKLERTGSVYSQRYVAKFH